MERKICRRLNSNNVVDFLIDVNKSTKIHCSIDMSNMGAPTDRNKSDQVRPTQKKSDEIYSFNDTTHQGSVPSRINDFSVIKNIN